jgi:hypothetical protein
MTTTTTTAPTAPSPAPREAAAPMKSRYWAAVQYLGLVIYQGFHQMEHALAVANQKLGADDVHPLLGGIDFEWLHLGFNAMLLWGLGVVLVGYGPSGRARWRATRRPYWYVFLFGFAVQSYHVVEHVVRTVQYRGEPHEPPGIITQVLDPAWFHFTINLVVLVAMTVAFFGLRVPADLRRRSPAGC